MRSGRCWSFSNYSALLPILQKEWTLTNSQVGLGRTMVLQSLLGWGAASLSPIAFGYILDITNPPDALDRFGYVPNWGWAFMLLGIGGLLGPLTVWRIKKGSGLLT